MPSNVCVSTWGMTWVKESKTLVTELSDIERTVGPRLPARMDLRSHRTKQLKEFVLQGESRDSENEVTAWNYVAADGVKLTVFND